MKNNINVKSCFKIIKLTIYYFEIFRANYFEIYFINFISFHKFIKENFDDAKMLYF